MTFINYIQIVFGQSVFLDELEYEAKVRVNFNRYEAAIMRI